MTYKIKWCIQFVHINIVLKNENDQCIETYKSL